ncbi:putative Adenylate/guanylate cyclase [Desulfamplus magnetovallimortis]|uniref:Putative Adenylate/guanylate cyclase n=1 Tax=Desulfamplus magnetovallimortis TaxID=1246637 RepID=A0A1W1H724_9BACT|nr:adenylate/guanylate cyclase domain-containing protein [Desulfamplus magnetovallimortis]SLM28257.1 putative Adenylate/guanylate cyclase [Desulfamplus magnetovallimortis]
MNFRLKSKKHIWVVALITLFLISVSLLIYEREVSLWNNGDNKLLDYFYRLTVRYGYGPTPSFSPGIVYLNITEETYDYFGKNYLDRRDLAPLNHGLRSVGAEGIVYDIIFARASSPEADAAFADSIDSAGNIYLPIAFALSDHPAKFSWKQDQSHEHMRSAMLGTPVEKGTARPFYAGKAMMQNSDFITKAAGSGNITAQADPDSKYRHITMITKVDDHFLPAFALAIFMDRSRVSMDDIIVEWGDRIILPATPANFLDNDVIIPIDDRGRTFIPYVNIRGKDFRQMSVHHFLNHIKNPDLMGNLLDFFEGNYVFVADIAVGTSDLGYTPLEPDVPLVNIHTSMLNALLTNTFYTKLKSNTTLIHMIMIIVFLGIAASFRSSWILYITALSIATLLPIFTWYQIINFTLFPLFTLFLPFAATFAFLVIFLEISTSRERAFIKNTFGRYVPEKVVEELLAKPEMISLGGEERVVSILFSDIRGFTSISESMSPTALVRLLNEFFTEMSEIIMKNDGIIDKFQGDAIMAEFGMPIPGADHADKAVSTAIKMLHRLSELKEEWKESDFPELSCRIGINTGKVIVGNMGSRTVMDYTVMGDAVNLASRLEGANKFYGTSLIISEFTLAMLTPFRFKTRILDYVKVKGKQNAVKIFEVYGINEPEESSEKEKIIVQGESITRREEKTDIQDEKYYTLYDRGFNSYLAKNLSDASVFFSKALALRPYDQAASLMLERLSAIDESKINDKSWEPSVSLHSK